MKAIDTHLYKRNTRYYYRIAVPPSLRDFLTGREILSSLNCQSIAEAKAAVATIDLHLNTAIQTSQNEDAAPETIAASISTFQEHLGKYGRKKLNRKTRHSIDQRQIWESPISEAYPLYLSSCLSLRPKTIDAKKKSYDLFIELMGNLPIKSINKRDARTFQEKLCQLTPLDKSKKAIDAKTVNFRLTCMNVLFNWVQTVSEDKVIANPFNKVRVKERKTSDRKRHPYYKEELDTLFASPLFCGCAGEQWRDRFTLGNSIIHDSLYWVPLIAYYTGMRLNEICQLHTDDIAQQNNIWHFDLNEKGNKRLKTASSIRKVPLHRHLIDLGLVRFAKAQANAGHTRLFSDLKEGPYGSYGFYFTKRYARLLKRLEIKREGLCFHSFRHTFIDTMKECGVERSIAMAICGHNQGASAHDFYGNGYSLSILAQSINLIPPLDGPAPYTNT